MPIDPTRSRPVGPAPTDPSSSQATARAIELFERRIGLILLEANRGPDGTPQLSDLELRALKRASSDLLMALPVDSFAPGVLSKLEGLLASRGVAGGSLAGKSLSDLGQLGGELAKEMVEDLRESSPATFYGLALGAAAAVGYSGYTKGSDGLAKLGVRPELKKAIFNDAVTLSAGARFEERFRNLGGDLGLSVGRSDLNGKAELRVGVDGDGLRHVEGGYSLQRDKFEVRAALRHDLLTHLTTGSIDAHYQPRPNVNLSVGGGTDSGGNLQAQVRLSVKF